jgi:hypothetical protein
MPLLRPAFTLSGGRIPLLGVAHDILTAAPL